MGGYQAGKPARERDSGNAGRSDPACHSDPPQRRWRRTAHPRQGRADPRSAHNRTWQRPISPRGVVESSRWSLRLSSPAASWPRASAISNCARRWSGDRSARRGRSCGPCGPSAREGWLRRWRSGCCRYGAGRGSGPAERLPVDGWQPGAAPEVAPPQRCALSAGEDQAVTLRRSEAGQVPANNREDEFRESHCARPCLTLRQPERQSAVFQLGQDRSTRTVRASTLMSRRREPVRRGHMG
jgi:hypothetical protein